MRRQLIELEHRSNEGVVEANQVLCPRRPLRTVLAGLGARQGAALGAGKAGLCISRQEQVALQAGQAGQAGQAEGVLTPDPYNQQGMGMHAVAPPALPAHLPTLPCYLP